MISGLYGFWPIYKRELKNYATSMGTYVIAAMLLLVVGAIYHALLTGFVAECELARKSLDEPPNITVAVIQATNEAFSGLLLFIAPILSMRLIASERSSGTFETLITCPVGDWGLLLGKQLALMTLGAVVVALSLVYPLATWWLGRKYEAAPEPAVVLSGVVGLTLIFGSYAAFGVMASALTRSQIVAGTITLMGLLAWNIVGDLPNGHPALRTLLPAISAAGRARNLIGGLLTVGDAAFFCATIFIFLFVAARALESRHWRA